MAKDNEGYKYFVIAIDMFSKYVWTRPLKTKLGSEMVKQSKLFSFLQRKKS